MTPHRRPTIRTCLIASTLYVATAITLYADDPWVVYEGGKGSGQGKHVVLVSGDEEYRSEEALPQLGKILATHHGFRCTVLFAINPETGFIDPNYLENIPGLEALDSADLMILSTRMRNLPGEQMQHIDHYLKAGKPVIGLRTATHAFKNAEGDWKHYGNQYKGDDAWRDGFGRLVLGEHWVRHHGKHKQESTRGIIATGAEGHPIVRGIRDGDLWAPSDVYGVRLPLPEDSQPLVLGRIVKRAGAEDKTDPYYGMRPTDTQLADDGRNDPMMPVAWTKSYRLPGGEQGRAFTTTTGASTDLTNAGVRRMIVNAAYWLLEMDVPAQGTQVDLVGTYEPTAFEFRRGNYWADRKMSVSEHAR